MVMVVMTTTIVSVITTTIFAHKTLNILSWMTTLCKAPDTFLSVITSSAPQGWFIHFEVCVLIPYLGNFTTEFTNNVLSSRR